MPTSIGDALFTKAQQKVLTLFFGQPESSHYLNEVTRLADMGRGVISRELSKLVDAGVLVVKKQGNQIHYQANAASPIYQDLIHIVKKTFGVSGVIKAALTPIQDQLTHAFIYGSVAKGEDHAASDIDVMLVGNDLSYSEIMESFETSEEQLQRPINPTIYTPQEFSERLADPSSFLNKVMAQSTINLLDEKSQDAT